MSDAEPKLTGRHVLIGFLTAFGVIIAVNMYLAVWAVRTFPGLEVENSYIASQDFNQRLAEQTALGWTATATADGSEIRLSLRDPSGKPIEARTLSAIIVRPATMAHDYQPAFTFDGADYVAHQDLEPGGWNVRLTAIAHDGTLFEQRLELLRE